MWDLSRKMREEDRTRSNPTASNPKSEDELLSHMSSAIRNLARHTTNDPPIWTTIIYEHPLTEEWNQGLGTKDSANRLQKLKDTTLTLYRQLALKAEEIRNGTEKTMHKNEPQNQEPEEDKLHMGKNNRKKTELARLKPAGAAETLGAMVDDQGSIITKHEDMADLLRNHWSQVFRNKETPRESTKTWFEEAFPTGPPLHRRTQQMETH